MSTAKVAHFEEGVRRCPGEGRGICKGGGDCVEASARSQQKRRCWHPKVRWWHRPGKNSGCEDVDDQLKVLARGCSLKQECRDKPGKAGPKTWASKRGDSGACQRGVIKGLGDVEIHPHAAVR